VSWLNDEPPEGWTAPALTEVADIVMGQSPPGVTYNTGGKGLPFFQGKSEFGVDHPTVRKWCTAPSRIAEPGDILMSVRAPVGPTNVADQLCAVGRGLAAIRVRPGVPANLVRHAIKLQEDEIASWGTGTTFTAISKHHFDEIRIPLPPKELRNDLAERLDQIVRLRRSSSTHILAGRRAITRFRQALLAAAYSEAQEEDGGTEVPLERLLREPLKNGYSAMPVHHVTPFRVLTLTATTSGWFNDRHFKYTDEQFSADSPFWLRSGDIVIQRGNTPEYVGVPALYEGAPCEFLYPDLMIRARVHADIAPRFVWYMLLAPQARAYVRERATGSAGNMPKVNQKILNQVPVPLPTIESRQRIVETLDRALARADSTILNLNNGADRLDRSLQAVLAKAFRGELVDIKGRSLMLDLPGPDSVKVRRLADDPRQP